MIRHWDKSQGDIVTSGSRVFFQGKEETAAGIYHRLRMFFGEYFLDITDGTPLFQTILGKFDRQSAEAAIKQRIITAPGVVAITRFRFDSDRNTRRITVDCTVLDINNQAVQLIFDGDILQPDGDDFTEYVPRPEAGYRVNMNRYSVVVDD